MAPNGFMHAASVVALTDTVSTASAFAARSGGEVKGNGEMIGIGAANVAAGLFQGFPVSTSGSRMKGDHWSPAPPCIKSLTIVASRAPCRTALESARATCS